MELAAIAVLVVFSLVQFSMIKKLENEVDRLWKYGVHIESVLRANDMWVVVDDKGNKTLGERFDSSLNAEPLKKQRDAANH